MSNNNTEVKKSTTNANVLAVTKDPAKRAKTTTRVVKPKPRVLTKDERLKEGLLGIMGCAYDLLGKAKTTTIYDTVITLGDDGLVTIGSRSRETCLLDRDKFHAVCEFISAVSNVDVELEIKGTHKMTVPKLLEWLGFPHSVIADVEEGIHTSVMETLAITEAERVRNDIKAKVKTRYTVGADKKISLTPNVFNRNLSRLAIELYISTLDAGHGYEINVDVLRPIEISDFTVPENDIGNRTLNYGDALNLYGIEDLVMNAVKNVCTRILAEEKNSGAVGFNNLLLFEFTADEDTISSNNSTDRKWTFTIERLGETKYPAPNKTAQKRIFNDIKERFSKWNCDDTVTVIYT